MSTKGHIVKTSGWWDNTSFFIFFILFFLFGAALLGMAIWLRVCLSQGGTPSIGLHEFFALLYAGTGIIFLSILVYVFGYSMEWARNRILFRMIVDNLEKDHSLSTLVTPHPWLLGVDISAEVANKKK